MKPILTPKIATLLKMGLLTSNCHGDTFTLKGHEPMGVTLHCDFDAGDFVVLVDKRAFSDWMTDETTALESFIAITLESVPEYAAEYLHQAIPR